ncbi:MAG TPA: hypothetical protein P5545_04330 [Bacteroidota bacterium]|nr:hypothetical protein [Candidatus Kapabacteria bacterium]HRS01756.1 hypothetical protein [Bacteroidota bacterium]HRT67344.1 hypothetical protein [Bacteroidota bacterium]
MKITFPVAAFIIFTFLSCTSDQILLNRYDLDEYLIYVNLLNGIEKAEKINDNSLKINSNAVISMKISTVTQYEMEFDLYLLSGNQMTIFLNTTNYDYKQQPDLEITLSDKGYKITNGDKILAKSDSLKIFPNENHRIKFSLDGNQLHFAIDCSALQFEIPHQISTEYIFFKTNRETSALINGVKLTNLRQE